MAGKKEVVQTIGVVGLTAVLAGVLFVSRLKGGGLFKSPWSGNVTPAPAPVTGEPQRTVELQPPSSPLVTLSSASHYTASDLRDPLKSFLPQITPSSLGATSFQPGGAGGSGRSATSAAYQRPPAPSLTVQGVVWGGPRPQAIINGRVYNIGDVVGGGKIVEINRHGVSLDVEGTRVMFSPGSGSKGQRGGHG